MGSESPRRKGLFWGAETPILGILKAYFRAPVIPSWTLISSRICCHLKVWLFSESRSSRNIHFQWNLITGPISFVFSLWPSRRTYGPPHAAWSERQRPLPSGKAFYSAHRNLMRILVVGQKSKFRRCDQRLRPVSLVASCNLCRLSYFFLKCVCECGHSGSVTGVCSPRVRTFFKGHRSATDWRNRLATVESTSQDGLRRKPIRFTSSWNSFANFICVCILFLEPLQCNLIIEISILGEPSPTCDRANCFCMHACVSCWPFGRGGDLATANISIRPKCQRKKKQKEKKREKIKKELLKGAQLTNLPNNLAWDFGVCALQRRYLLRVGTVIFFSHCVGFAT